MVDVYGVLASGRRFAQSVGSSFRSAMASMS